jgi:alpha-galactosidase
MPDSLKIVFIGAGSKTFASGLINDIVSSPDVAAANLHVQVWLVDIHADSLKRMHGYAARAAAHRKSTVEFIATTDRCQALPGADFVIVAVDARRMELWEQDFRVGMAFGFRHVLGENAGPGGLFHALRNLHIIMPICRDVELLCPEAVVFNFTNPESIMLTGITTLTKLRAFGLCHGFYALWESVKRLLGREPETLDIRTAGINHLFTFYKISDPTTGEDLIPEFKRKIAENIASFDNLTRFLFEKFGVLGYHHQGHTGEFIGYADELCLPLWNYGVETCPIPPQLDRAVTASDLYWATNENASRKELAAFLGNDHQGQRRFDAYIDGCRPLDNEFLKPSGELAIPIICDIVFDRHIRRPAVNLLNTGKYIPNLSEDGCIEIPAVFSRGGAVADQAPALPEGFAAMLRVQHSVHKLMVMAYQEKSRTLLLQALLTDPVTNSPSRAEKFMDYMLELQAAYLPAMK